MTETTRAHHAATRSTRALQFLQLLTSNDKRTVIMSFTAWLFFLPACFAINMAPGPNNLLSINVAARHGFTTAFIAGMGRLVAFALMLVLAGTGLAVVLHASELFF